MEKTLNRLLDFFDIEDENGVSNLDKVHKYQKVLRRAETTDKSKSVEAVENGAEAGDVPNGIILKDGKTPDEPGMRKFIKEHLASHKVPRYILFVDSFPMNAAGKVLKYKMREDIEKMLSQSNSI